MNFERTVTSSLGVKGACPLPTECAQLPSASLSVLKLASKFSRKVILCSHALRGLWIAMNPSISPVCEEKFTPTLYSCLGSAAYSLA
jgi:hypothetical protein